MVSNPFIVKIRKVPYNRLCGKCGGKVKHAQDTYLKDMDGDLKLIETEYLCDECYVEGQI